jgi:hypothetical protein
MSDLPLEITVVDRGEDDVTFSLPRRDLGKFRFVGLVLLAGTAVFLYWVTWIGVTNIARLNRPVQPEDYVMLALGGVLALGAYFPIWLGLAILAGKREVTLHGGQLRATERVGPLWRTKRYPLDKLVRVEIIGLTPTSAAAPEGSFIRRMDALSGLLVDGRRFMIAQAYPRRLLGPVAAEIARRCNAKYDPDRPGVVVTTIDAVDPLAQWNDDSTRQPANSRAVVNEFPEGVTITLPPAGLRGGGGTLLTIGLMLAGIMAGLVALTRGLPVFLQGLFAVLGVVGLLIAIHGVRVARRRAVLAVVDRELLVMQTGLIRSKERRWQAEDLSAVRVDKSGIEINDEPVLELQIVPRTGIKFGLLAGRDVAEIAWIAAVLRKRLGPTARA